ncbi:hypothetical protein HWV62_2105 [Athelia sp. TMB]|nr:hypothetical protein HWV62_2105 [Athelia sp. TMB]
MASPLANLDVGNEIGHPIVYVDWTPAEKVLMDLGNEDSADGILDRLCIKDAIAFGATCKRVRATWLHYTGKVFNLNKFLTHYMPNAPAFRQMMEATSSVVNGRCVTEMLRRNNPLRYPLTMITGPIQASVVRLHLEEEQGYRAFGENEYWVETRSIGTYARSRGIRPSKVNLRSAFLSQKATKRHEFPIKQLLTLARIDDQGCTSYVILQVPKTHVSKTFMAAGTTACANVMTHNRVVAFYPRVTFVHQRNFTIYRATSARRWRLAIPHNRAFHQCATTELVGDDYDLLDVTEGRNASRQISDAECWTLLYDQEGNKTVDLHTAAFTQRKDDLEGNSWFLRVESGKIALQVEAARLSNFDPNL